MATFRSDTRAAVDSAQLTLAQEQAALRADNVAAQTLLNSQTDGLIATLTAVREALEVRLQTRQDEIQTDVEERRDLDMIEMTTT